MQRFKLELSKANVARPQGRLLASQPVTRQRLRLRFRQEAKAAWMALERSPQFWR